MDVEKNKQINYLRYMGDKMRIVHTVRSDSPLKPVPSEEHFNSEDKLERSNIRKQVRVRKKVMAGLHSEIKYLYSLLEEPIE